MTKLLNITREKVSLDELYDLLNSGQITYLDIKAILPVNIQKFLDSIQPGSIRTGNPIPLGQDTALLVRMIKYCSKVHYEQ